MQQAPQNAPRSLCFTLKVDSLDAAPAEAERLQALHPAVFDWLCFQLEKGDGGFLHFQGCGHTARTFRFGTFKNHLGATAHIEKMRGTVQQARDYCRKDDTRQLGPYEVGHPPQQGRRRDLEAVRELIAGGATEREVAEQHFPQWCIYRRSFTAYRDLLRSDRDWLTECVFYWGAPGTGKSRRAFSEAGPDAYAKLPGKWFDGYSGQEHVVIDDLHPGELTATLFKRLADRYPLRVEVKGDTTRFLAKKIWITSNHAIEDLFPDATNADDLDAVKRRITTEEYFPPSASDNQ